jgi:Na+-translocating ferredoxin:NAD+ oxidoreductase RnfC subunit
VAEAKICADEAGVVQLVVAAMCDHEAHKALQCHACGALQSLCTPHSELAARARDAGAWKRSTLRWRASRLTLRATSLPRRRRRWRR